MPATAHVGIVGLVDPCKFNADFFDGGRGARHHGSYLRCVELINGDGDGSRDAVADVLTSSKVCGHRVRVECCKVEAKSLIAA
jgi:hypothetical protein